MHERQARSSSDAKASDVESLVRTLPGRNLLRRSWWRVRKFPARLPLRNSFPRTSRYPSEPAALIKAAVAFAAAFAVLIAFGTLVSHVLGPVQDRSTLDSLVHTVTRPVVAGPIAFMMAVLCGRFFRAARLAWLAWSPGPIVVPDFSMPRPISDATPEQLTALFRAQLAFLQLDTAKPSPGATPQGSFLDVLDSYSVSSSNILRTLLTLLRASWPTHVYEVTGMIQEGEGVMRCGVTVQAVRLPGEPGALVQIWESSWERAAQRAADGAIAAVLPRTRLCRGPWASWRRFQPPGDLLTAYREAGALVTERRYDDALGRYREALELDPTNLTVILQLGQLQEKIGLFIGALTTYQRILALDNPGKRPLPSGLQRRGTRREWERSVLIAKYRQIVLLGQGSVVREWCKKFTDDPENYRSDLRKYFRGELEPLTIRRHDPAADAIGCAIAKLIKHESDSGEIPIEPVHRELMPFAYQAGYELQRSLSRIELRAWQQPLTRRTVGLTLASLRLSSELRCEDQIKPPWQPGLVGKLKRTARWAGWRPGLWAGWCPPMPLRMTWQQHYNAACLYAMPLALECDSLIGQPVTEEPTSRDHTTAALARLAVDRLERAASRADSAFVATRRDWVLEEDLDLRGLRHHPEFKAFEGNYFPSPDDPAGLIFHNANARRNEQRTRPALISRARESQTQYAHDLLTAVSARWHELWHERAEGDVPVDPHVLVCWWDEETQIWGCYEAVVRSRFDWLLRKRLLAMSTELAVNNGLGPVIARYCRLDTADVSSHDSTALRGADRFKLFDRALKEGEPLAEHSELLVRCSELLRHADAEALEVYAHVPLASLCHTQAAIWQTLEECLSGCFAEEDAAIKKLAQRVSNAAALWARAERGVGPSR